MASMFTLAAVKNTLDEVRAQVYPRNETEKKVGDFATTVCELTKHTQHSAFGIDRCMKPFRQRIGARRQHS
jgi:hypothetical protein